MIKRLGWAATEYPSTLYAFPRPFVIAEWQFLLELDKPLGTAGNHALAGRYATMLKSAPDFDYTFTKASAGLNYLLLYILPCSLVWRRKTAMYSASRGF